MFALVPIRVGEVVLFQRGTLYAREDLEAGRIPRDASYSFIAEDLILAEPGDDMDFFINHACDPTV